MCNLLVDQSVLMEYRASKSPAIICCHFGPVKLGNYSGWVRRKNGLCLDRWQVVLINGDWLEKTNLIVKFDVENLKF